MLNTIYVEQTGTMIGKTTHKNLEHAKQFLRLDQLLFVANYSMELKGQRVERKKRAKRKTTAVK